MNPELFYPIFLKSGKIVIDSRKIEPGDIFFAFSGDTFNAATLAEGAVNSGALAVIVERQEYEDRDKNIFYVPSTLSFLQDLARYHRSRLSIPVIGLTGSNGKTTTKELIHAVLSQKFNVQYTSGNLNNHIGVPLTLLTIKPEHEIAVVEMGANHQKEIETLCKIAMPTIGYITNFGKAHLEGFGGLEGVVKGKSELYEYLLKNERIVLVNSNDPLQTDKTEGYPHTISFGGSASDFHFEQFSENNRVGLIIKDRKVLSNLTGNYNFTNLCAAAALGEYFRIDAEQIAYAVENYHPTNMRSQVIHRSGKTMVLDTYNANPSSMVESLKNFTTFPGTKTVIMGDMLELGKEASREHASILILAQSLGFDEIITVGNNFSEVKTGAKSFLTTGELKEYLSRHRISSDNVLLKGSRGIALESILEDIR